MEIGGNKKAQPQGCALQLPRQGSNLDSSDPESDVLPVTPRGTAKWS
jgi:hypothetical protein